MRKILFIIIAALGLAAGRGCTLTIPDGLVQGLENRVRVEIQSNLPAGAPPAEIVRLADQAGMTPAARAIFYAARPQIDPDRQTLDQDCQARVMQNTAELGCYTSDNRIYLLNISDPRLSQEMVVVAAHEMLHAAYEQLSADQQASVNSQLEAELKQVYNADLAQRLSVYRTLEPGQRDNELHSIFGTEFSRLSPALETYYGQYFSSRQQVVADSTHFDAVFSTLQSALDSLRSQITRLRGQMQVDLARHRYPAYNSLVPQINALVSRYNQDVSAYNNLSGSLLDPVSPASAQ